MSPKGVYERVPRTPAPIAVPRLIPLLCVMRDESARVVAFALVDEEDYERLTVYRWGLTAAGYARRQGVDGQGRPRGVLMHREILQLVIGDGLAVDHVNRNKLDNRKMNLRRVTAGENSQNQTPRARGTSTYRGVSWDKERKRWVVWGKVEGRAKFLGRFIREADAAAAAETFRRAAMPYSDEGVGVQ